MDNLEGGFVIHRAPAILAGYSKHTVGLPGRPVSEFDLEATNRLQATEWRVNASLLGVARDLFTLDTPTPIIPGNERVVVPGRKPDDEWEAMDEAARKAHRTAIGRALAENTGRAGRRAAFVDCLNTATDMEVHPSFWFPWCHDFRLRRYPVACGGLSPQGSDLSKSLLMFSTGKPLGDAGFYWLCVRLANAMDNDKAPLDDRVGWVLDRMATWEAVARDPVGMLDAWALVSDKGEVKNSPWEALATIFEVVEAARRPEDFYSHLPVNMDGSCNGLQHLSAMGLDPTGAFATNLTSHPERQDVYLQVAAFAKNRVETDAAKGLPVAMVWLGHVGRDTVKRAVLATPYGVTDQGIQKQLLDDRKVPQSDTVSAREASAYFRDVLVDALSDTVVAAKQIMGWLQTCGMRLAEAGLPLIWETPTGSTVQQAYREQSARRVNTLAGRVQLVDELDGSGLQPRKQALGSAPNVVHSFDAAHLARVTNVLGREYDVADFAMIHDSFGVHACDTPAMHAVIRSEFVAMYAEDQLARLHAGFRAAAPYVELPDPPERGCFDLSSVRDARFFFA